MTPADRSHDLIEELIAADVLHGLDEVERRRLERELEGHGPSCAECDRLIAEYSEVAARIALSLDPAALSPGAEDRVLALAREGTPGPRTLPVARGRRWVAIVSVAAAFALIGAVVGRALPPSSRVDARFLAFAAQPGTRLIPFPAKGGQRLAVAVNPEEPGGWIVGTGLPGLANDKVYELWYLPTSEGSMQPAGTFLPSGGSVAVPVTVGSSFVALAVSIEPHGGSKTPTLPPVFITNTTSSL